VVATSSSTTDQSRLVLLGVGVALGIVAVASLVIGERRARRARRSAATERSGGSDPTGEPVSE
jgi:hypothetical protein